MIARSVILSILTAALAAIYEHDYRVAVVTESVTPLFAATWALAPSGVLSIGGASTIGAAIDREGGC